MFVRRERFEVNAPLARLLLVLAVFYYVSLWQGAFYLNGPLPLSFDDSRFSDWKNYVEMFLLFVVVTSVIKDRRQAQLLLAVMAVSVLLVNRSYYGTIGGRDFSNYSDSARYSGALGYAGPNGFAAFEVMASALFLGIAAYQRRILVKLGIFALVGTCVYCILFSFSRAGYLGLLAALVVLGLFKERKLLILVAVVLVAWQTLLPEAVRQRIAMTSQNSMFGRELDSSSESRVEIWEDAYNLFKENPILGVGFDTYGFLGRVEDYGDTHNYYVEVLVETGLLGLVLFLWLLKGMWGLGFSLARSAKDPFWASIGLGFVALISSAAVLNLFGDRWTYQQVTGFLWVSLGLVARGLLVQQEEEDEQAEPEGVPEMSEVSSEVVHA
jgi:O-antigen ligase